MIPALSPETWLVLAVLALSLAITGRAAGLGWWERPIARLARRRKLAVMLSAAAPLILRALLLPWHPAPEPRVHDEFTLLLGADTFAHGRLVNPQHPLWVHFESMHLLTRPAYASAFPVGQSILLAAGKVLFGQAWAGVWIGIAFMCGAICWMLQGWLPPRWALLGALLVVLKWGVSGYWMNTYWGGGLAAAGGALALGALPRLVRRARWTNSAVMGLGLAILANTRPFEGAVFGFAIGVALCLGMRGQPREVLLREVVVPLAMVLAVTAAAMGYYFERVTGKPWLMPYVLYRDTMSMAPHFLWQRPRPEPLYNNYEMHRFYVDSEMNDYRVARGRWLSSARNKVEHYGRFYAGPLLSVPLLTALLFWRDRRTRMLVGLAAAVVASLVVQVWDYAHYAAPAAGLAILLAVIGIRGLRLWRWRGRRVGLVLARCLPTALAAMLAIQIASATGDASWRWASFSGTARARILHDLQNAAGQHLVFVRYDRAHDSGYEWVYNDADIDASKVVWARELDRASNEKLMRYYGARKVWLVEPDLAPPRVQPYRDAPSRPMPFVALGAPGIEVLSPDSVKKEVGTLAAGAHTCDEWNFYFTQATGVAGPDTGRGCYVGDERGKPLSFEDWFAWLKRQH